MNFFKRRYPEILAVLLSLSTIGFAVAEHLGWVDTIRGLDSVKGIANSYDLSYGPNSPEPVYPGNPAWPVLLGMIQHHNPNLPDRRPLTIARYKALASTVNVNLPGLPQWTAPGTPILLLYRKWPAPGTPPIEREDYRVVGTIGDLHTWIKEDSDNFHSTPPALVNSASSIIAYVSKNRFLAIAPAVLVDPDTIQVFFEQQCGGSSYR